MKRLHKYTAILFAALVTVGAARMIIDPAYREKVQHEQELRKQEEVQEAKDKVAACLQTRALTQQQWNAMSQLMQSLVATECRPPFAPERTAKELLNSAGRATQRSTKRIGESVESTLNTPF